MKLSDRVVATEMEEWVFRGLNTTIRTIIRHSNKYLRQGSDTDKEKAYRAFKKIEDFFGSIPLGILYGWEPEYEPLQVIHKLLPILRMSLDKVLEERNGHALFSLSGIAEVVKGIETLYEGYTAIYRNKPRIPLYDAIGPYFTKGIQLNLDPANENWPKNELLQQ